MMFFALSNSDVMSLILSLNWKGKRSLLSPSSLELGIEEIKHADGVKKILEQLDKLYLQDTNQSAHLACQIFEELN